MTVVDHVVISWLCAHRVPVEIFLSTAVTQCAHSSAGRVQGTGR